MTTVVDIKDLTNRRVTPVYRVIDRRNNMDVFRVGIVYELQLLPGKKRRRWVRTEKIVHSPQARYKTMADVNAIITKIIRMGFQNELDHLKVTAYTYFTGYIEKPDVKMDKKIEAISLKVLLEKLKER